MTAELREVIFDLRRGPMTAQLLGELVDIVLCVADDGVREAAVPSANGHGLRNMRARAVRLGGRMDISHPGRGTT